MAKFLQQVQLLATALVLLNMWHHVANASFTERFDTVVNEKITGIPLLGSPANSIPVGSTRQHREGWPRCTR
jgi:hypothetical protein